MKFIAAALLVALAGFAAGLFLPWWSIAVVAAVVAMVMNLKPGQAFLSALLGACLLWGGIAFLRSSLNDDILAHRMSQFILNKDSPGLLILATSLVGGLTGAMGALSGSLLKRLRGDHS